MPLLNKMNRDNFTDTPRALQNTFTCNNTADNNTCKIYKLRNNTKKGETIKRGIDDPAQFVKMLMKQHYQEQSSSRKVYVYPLFFQTPLFLSSLSVYNILMI